MQLRSRDELPSPLQDGRLVLVEPLPHPPYDAEHLPPAVTVSRELTAELAARLGPERDRTVSVYYSGELCGRPRAEDAITCLGRTEVRFYTDGRADWTEAELAFHGTCAITKAG